LLRTLEHCDRRALVDVDAFRIEHIMPQLRGL
jgi:hypothetical protein